MELTLDNYTDEASWGTRTREEYLLRVSDPETWAMTARDFASSAEDLVAPIARMQPAGFETSVQGVCAPHMVLFAIAVENMIKAILVAQGGEATRPDGSLSDYLKRHDALAMAKDARLKPTEDEADLLTWLTDLMESGRYPVATGPGENPRATWSSYPTAVTRVRLLLKRLEARLAELTGPSPQAQ